MADNWEKHALRPRLNADQTRGRFAGYVALVTGGGNGIGKACARRLLSDGASVAAIDLDIDGLDDVKREYGPMVQAYRADVSNVNECKAIVDEVARAHGGFVTTLINCAAAFVYKGEDAKHEDWKRIFAVNVEGYANMVQACFPYMISGASKGRSSVVNLSSVSAHIAQPNRWTYSASKGAVHTLTKCMALDLSPHGIRVNAMSPSWIWTQQIANAAKNGRSTHEAVWKDFFMLRRLGEAEEVAAAACFLCSEDAAYITGVDLPCDGGYLALGPEGLGESSSFAGTSESA